jgi:hypothetical protein
MTMWLIFPFAVGLFLLVSWASRAAERYMGAYIARNPGTIDANEARRRLWEDPGWLPGAYVFLFDSFRMMVTAQPTAELERLRRGALRRFAICLVYLVVGFPIMLWAAQVVRMALGSPS